MDQLSRIVQVSTVSRQSRSETALLEPKQFASEMASAALELSSSNTVDGAIYNQFYLDISNRLRTIATNYVRLISSSRQEMAKNYVELTDLAARWRWFSELTRTGADALPAEPNDNQFEPEEWKRRHQQLQSETDSALGVIKETSQKLADLAQRATRKQMPAVY